MLDDEAFYVAQAPFSLAAQRAIALALNSLTFHTHVSPTAPQRPASAAGAAQHAALRRHIQGTLLALHARDVRRPFCAPVLWLAPWARESALSGADRKVLLGGVRRVLLARSEADDDGEAAATAAAGQSSSVANLLQAAPQCVPYGLRVDLFRELLRLDKVGVTGLGLKGQRWEPSITPHVRRSGGALCSAVARSRWACTAAA